MHIIHRIYVESSRLISAIQTKLGTGSVKLFHQLIQLTSKMLVMASLQLT